MRSPKITMTERQLAKKLANEHHRGWRAAWKVNSLDIPCKSWKHRERLVTGLGLLRDAGLLPRIECSYSSGDTKLTLRFVTAREKAARARAREQSARRDRALARKYNGEAAARLTRALNRKLAKKAAA